MSIKLATEVIGRFNLRESLVAAQYINAPLVFRTLADVDDTLEDASWEAHGITRTLAAYGFNPTAERKPFAFAEGLAIIPVHGMTLNRFASSWGYVTGYQFVRNQLNAALADPDVKGIVFDMNSNGGEAAGCFELAAEIRGSRAVKPSLCVVDSACYSAGYAIGSAASKIVSTPSGGIGSIGVVVMHASIEGMLKDAGVEITFIHAGAHKVDGNMFQNLSDSVKARVQKSVDKSYDAFVALVAENRGLDAKAVRATEALTYNADDALSLGLIDAVATPQAAIAAFINELSGSTSSKKGKSMQTEDQKPGAGATATTAEDLNKAKTEARAAERQRMAAITGCDEAKDKPKLASHLAMNTEMSVEDAKAVLLAAAPEVTSEPKAEKDDDAFKKHMNNEGGAGVKANTVENTKQQTKAEQILSAQSAVCGKRQ